MNADLRLSAAQRGFSRQIGAPLLNQTGSVIPPVLMVFGPPDAWKGRVDLV